MQRYGQQASQSRRLSPNAYIMNVDMKKVLYVLLPQFAEHELPYLTQTLRSDAMAMKENYKLGHVEVVKMMSQAGG